MNTFTIKRDTMWTIPNILTSIRLALIPVFLIVFYLPQSWSGFWAAFIFTLAAVTDLLDGYLARKLNQQSPFGEFLDPVADKLMVAAALVAIAVAYQSFWVTLPAVVMICREILISALREWMAELGKRDNVAVSFIGKVKTVAQMASLAGLIWQPGGILQTLFLILFYAATVLTFWSMFSYLKIASKDLLNTK
jgi:CDP-diacylglycerol--glycerol-3-phosphate 3-phosphatidyltransferase